MRETPPIARFDPIDRVQSKTAKAIDKQFTKDTKVQANIGIQSSEEKDIVMINRLSDVNRELSASNSDSHSLSTNFKSSTTGLARTLVKNLEKTLVISTSNPDIKSMKHSSNTIPGNIGLPKSESFASEDELDSGRNRKMSASASLSSLHMGSGAVINMTDNVQRLMEAGRIIRITPVELLCRMESSSSAEDWSLLYLDMRQYLEFNTAAIRNSINMNLMPLLIKRFRRLGVSSFNVANCLTTDASRRILENWQQPHSIARKCIVIYDSNISSSNCETDTWAFIVNAADSLSHEFVKGTQDAKEKQCPVIFAYLEGGFDAFTNLEGADKFLAPEGISQSTFTTLESDQVNLPNMTDVSAWPTGAKLRLGVNNNLQEVSSPASLSGNIASSPSIRKGSKFGLSINTANRARSGSRAKPTSIIPNSPATATSSMRIHIERPPSRMKSYDKLEIVDSQEKYDSDENSPLSANAAPLTSPHDNAQPPDPYSKVNSNILIGSDVIPHAEDAIERFKALGVTHILNMAAEVTNQRQVQDCPDLTLKWLPVLDNTEQDMDGPLKEAIDFIDGAISANPNNVVFVHCKAGRSRSVSVVIGYLIVGKKYTLKNAYDHVRSCRKGVSPNLGFMAALLKVEKETHGVNSTIP